jgi:hypothetical protein
MAECSRDTELHSHLDSNAWWPEHTHCTQRIHNVPIAPLLDDLGVHRTDVDSLFQ